MLLYVSSGHRSPFAVQTLRELLDDADPNVVDGALNVLSEYLLGFTGNEFHDPDNAIAAFSNWFPALDPAARHRHRREIMTFLALFDPVPQSGPGPHVLLPLPVTLSELDNPWLLDTSLDVDFLGATARQFILRAEHAEVRKELNARFAVIDGLPAKTRKPPSDQTASSWTPLTLATHLRLLAALSDPHPRVRWAAARILAVCRDDRALPVVHDWLKNDPKASQSAHRVLAELFGPDWRKPFENAAAATSQPRVPHERSDSGP